MASVVTEYFRVLCQYRKLYGDDTVVLMQVGSFYEMYGVDNDTETLGNVQEISQLLNVILTKMNKKSPGNSRKNPLMLGFPCLALSKYVPVLLDEDYTIIVVDQVKVGLVIKREVTDVISKSTYLEGNYDEYIVFLYIDNHVHIGISAINVITGKSAVHECHASKAEIALEEAGSFAQQYRPKEVVVSSSAIDSSIEKYLGLSSSVKYSYRHVNKIASDVNYQNMVLGCVWVNKTMMSNIELLDLECRPFALTSYVLLIEYVCEHKPLLVKKLSKPSIYIPKDHLVLAANTVEQLNITTSGKSLQRRRKAAVVSCLLDVIDSCSTVVGRRLLRERLLSPIYDPAELESRYQQITEYAAIAEDTDQKLGKLLTKIDDIEKLARRMSLGVINPCELTKMHSSYVTILAVDNLWNTLDEADRRSISDFIATCENVFIMENMQIYNLDGTSYEDIDVFREGIYSDLDELKHKISHEMQKITAIATGVDNVRVECLPNTGYYLVATNTRGRQLSASSSIVQKYFLSFKPGKVGTKITSPDIESASAIILALTEELRVCTKQYYNKVLRILYKRYSALFFITAKNISQLDVTRSNYKLSVTFKYCRPTISPNHEKSGYFDAKGLRHAVMERIDSGVEYVPNDVSIGVKHNGIVLYSMNAGGKTSLLKACGIAVILAQIGAFVPADAFVFYPFSALITRIISEDNILRGRSSFVAEMSELRIILSKADSNTLVLADEITHGTEHTSGSAIFTSSVMTLAERRVNFMFTTHLHNVYPLIKNIDNVKICHLAVSIRDDTIAFERTLCDGPGSSIYGLEVCEFMDMDSSFIARAFAIRNRIDPDKRSSSLSPIQIHKNKYNTNVFVQTCTVCNYSPRQDTDMPLDVHHIKHQCSADNKGFIDTVHKNSKSNLVVLCKQCHIKAHNGTIEIHGYVKTSSGIKISMNT